MVALEQDFCEPHHSEIQSPEGLTTIPASEAQWQRSAVRDADLVLRVRSPSHVESATLHQHNKTL